ncbi:hypothetical protein BDZ89DRAFT_1067629 [Hymenopellis radicata]|nr:hypothetical protein BDZ89DRAFT_1067629 [Hymenopellis radicata]
MDLVTFKPFPDLPTDVARFLLETAAWEDACTAQVLARVSKIVRQWIDPILYHAVTLHTVPQLVGFTESISARNDSAFFARSVKILRLGNLTHGQFEGPDGRLVPFSAITELIRIVLNECSGARRLAFWVPVSEDLHAFTVSSGYIRLSHLSILDVRAQRLTLDKYVKFVPPSLTHLHLYHNTEDEDNVQSISWQLFAACPGLSHFCLSGPIASRFLTDRAFLSLVTDPLTALPSNIAMFVLYVDYFLSMDTQSDIDMVISQADCDYYWQIANLHCFSKDCDIESDWGYGGITDIWEYADICLAKQNQRRQDDEVGVFNGQPIRRTA